MANELLTGLVCVGLLNYHSVNDSMIQFLPGFILFVLLSAIAQIDWKHLIIPNSLVLTGILLGLTTKFLHGSGELTDGMIAGVISFTAVGAIRFAGNTLFRKETMGFGDVKLSGMLGLWLGIAGFGVAFWIASVMGAVYGITAGLIKVKGQPPRLKDTKYMVLETRPDSSLSLQQLTHGETILQAGQCGKWSTGSVRIPFGSFLAVSSGVTYFFLDDIQSIAEKIWMLY